MDTEPDRQVSWITVVVALFLMLIFTVIPAQFLRPSVLLVYYPVFFIVLPLLLLGVIGWDIEVNDVPENERSEKEKHRREAISNRMYHWTVGVPASPDQFYIFLLTVGGDLCIFSSVFWMLRSFYVPERKGILIALLPVFLFQIGKMFAEMNLHPFVYGQSDVESLFYWRSILRFIVRFCLLAGIYVGVWYLLKLIYQRQEWIFLKNAVNGAVLFYILGGIMLSIDFDDLYDRVRRSMLFSGLVLVFALACLILLCVAYSTFFIELERTL